MELEEAIQTLKDFAKYGRYYSNNTEHHMKTAINTVLNHLTKQEKMIELMADMITELKPAHFKKEKGGELAGEYRCFNKKEWKQYFEKKAEENK